MKPHHVPETGGENEVLTKQTAWLSWHPNSKCTELSCLSHYMLTLAALLGADRRNLRLEADRLGVSANFHKGALSSPRSSDDAKCA